MGGRAAGSGERDQHRGGGAGTRTGKRVKLSLNR